MDVGLIHMSGHHELMLAFGEFHSQLIAQAVGLLRGDFPRLEGLNDTVHEDIMGRVLSAPGGQEVQLFAGFKFLGGRLRQTHIGGHQIAADGFLRLLVVVQMVRHEPPPVAHGLAGVQAGNCHSHLLCDIYSRGSRLCCAGGSLLEYFFGIFALIEQRIIKRICNGK